MREWLKFWLPIIALIGGMMYGCVKVAESRHNYMEQYAVEHNCRWDYNDMCYTREQRPWLFED